MDLPSSDRLRHLCLVIGFTHGMIYLLVMWALLKVTENKHHKSEDGDEEVPMSDLNRAYIVMAALSLAESISGIVLIGGILKTKPAFMLPWLMVTIITIITGIVYAVTKFPYGLMVMLTMPLIIWSYRVMAGLSLAVASSAFVLIAAIVKTKTVYMLPWLIVTPITIITGLVYTLHVFPYIQTVIVTIPLTLSFLALFPVFFLYLKYRTISQSTPTYSTCENYPLNEMASAPPLPPDAPAASNKVSETLGCEPPSYAAAMSTSPGPPYSSPSSSMRFKTNSPYPVASHSAAVSTSGDPPYPLESSSAGFKGNPPYPMPVPSTAPTLGWRMDLVENVAKK